MTTFSYERADQALSLQQLILAFAFALALLVVCELGWRTLGGSSGYIDSKSRWSWVRSQVNKNPGVVLLGDSRMQFGFSLPAFVERYPQVAVYQLAVAAEQPYAALRDLADDEKFTGTVIISFTPEIVLAQRRDEQQPYVDHYHKRWKIDPRLNFYLGNLAERMLVTRQYSFGLDSVLRSVIAGDGLPQATRYMHTKMNREIDADYTFEDVSVHRRNRERDASRLYEQLYPVSVSRWQKDLADFLALAKRINDRGGCVIAVRFPSQHGLYDFEQKLFPKNSFWAQLTQQNIVRTVHFDSMPIMNSIELPDSQHVGIDDKYRFTKALLNSIAATKSSTSASTHCKL